jgi:4-hydroxy-tetrahydrodipicolinate synthase
MVATVKTLLNGVNVAAITPRRESGHEIDLALTFEVVDFLCAKGVNGIGLLGTTGEYVHYDFEQRTRLVGLVVKRSRAPVVVNVTHSTLDGTVWLAEEAAGSGAAGVMLMPPYYFRYDQDLLRTYFLEFVRQAALRIPVFLYNVPFFTTPMEPATACELLATGEFAGIKDSSGRMDYYRALEEQRNKTPFTLIIGNDIIFAEARAAGADGVVSGVACALPELMLALERAVMSGQADRIAVLDARLREFIVRLDRFPVPVGIKAALAARGIKAGPHAVPAGESGRKLLDEFSGWLRDWIPQVLRESAT